MTTKDGTAAPQHTIFAPAQPPEEGSALANFLIAFRSQHELNTKGKIASMIFASRWAREEGLPLDTTKLTTVGEGQVAGLSGEAVQKILADYGITRVLAAEGGRTSRGSIGYVRQYFSRLNDLHAQSTVDLASIEAWWVDQAKQFFNAKPFTLRFETGKALNSVIRDLIAQAKKRQKDAKGTMFVGAMLQHLVGAKLELVLPNAGIVHNGFSVADAAAKRAGDFDIGSSAIHVTTAPGEAVIRKCVANLDAGLQPIIVTLQEMVPAAFSYAEAQGIHEKLDVLGVEQFLVANLHEMGKFQGEARKVSVNALVDKYNEIVDQHESDPSLRIAKA